MCHARRAHASVGRRPEQGLGWIEGEMDRKWVDGEMQRGIQAGMVVCVCRGRSVAQDVCVCVCLERRRR